MMGAIYSPRLYTGLMRLLGADAGMEVFVRQFLRPEPGDRILDMGCGPGRLVPHVAAARYCGIDKNGRSIARARLRFPAVRFLHMDVCAEHPEFEDYDFDVAVACGVLHHLPDSQASRMFEFCHERLRSAGRLITLDCVLEEGQHPISKLLVSIDRGRFARNGAAYLRLAADRFPGAVLTLRHDLLQVPYSHAILECVKPCERPCVKP